MIHINNLKLTFGEQIVFDDVSWHIKRQERIGLIGANGAGKSTLLKTVLGRQHYDAGKILIAKGVTLGYLPQEAIEVKGKPLLEEVMAGVAEVKELEREIEVLQHTLTDSAGNGKEYEQRMRRLGLLQHRFEDLGGFQLENEAKKILSGLGFSETDLNRPVEQFSGGWQMRIALSKLLLQQPTLLLLDEPTNHLDIVTMEWLEGYLQNYQGTIIIVSHDRFFLERVTKKIALLEHGKLTEFSGSYSFYEKKRELMEEQLWQQYERQKDEVARIERFIERFRYKASKASQVQSRVKQLEKMKRIIPPSAQKSIRFYFPSAARTGRIVAEAAAVSQVYNGKTVFSNVSLKIESGDKLALVGPNGAGKSTFCRIISNTEAPFAGTAQMGHNVKVAFYTQESADMLSGNQTVLEEITESAPALDQSRLRTLLGSFLFSGDDVFKPVSVLSGGEKSRLALAKLLLQESNFLILDEPTNHLDASSKEVLQEACKAYQGTLILVSHDRYFLDKIISKVIEVRDGHLREFLGNYSEYLERRDLPVVSEFGTPPAEVVKSVTEPASAVKKSREEKRIEAEERQRKYQEKREQEKKIKPIENKIARLEDRKGEIETTMSQPDFFANPNQVRELSREYRQINEDLARLYLEWEQAQQ